jgi:group I intron endonuclease
MIGVYAIVHVPTNRAYVGSATNLARRFKEHRTSLRASCHHSHYLQNAWNKYGENSFEFKILLSVDTTEEAREIEQALLDCFYESTMNCKPSAIGFPSGDAHHSKRADFHMKTVMQRLTAEERKERYGKSKGKKRNGENYKLGAIKRLNNPNYTKVLSESCKGAREIVECPHCNKKGGGGNMKRYHFDNCKAKK